MEQKSMTEKNASRGKIRKMVVVWFAWEFDRIRQLLLLASQPMAHYKCHTLHHRAVLDCRDFRIDIWQFTYQTGTSVRTTLCVYSFHFMIFPQSFSHE